MSIKVVAKGETKLDNLLNTAPYFETVPEEMIFGLENDTNTFVYDLPPLIDDNGDSVTLEFLNELPENVIYDEKNNQLIFEKVAEIGVYNI